MGLPYLKLLKNTERPALEVLKLSALRFSQINNEQLENPNLLIAAR